MMCDLQGHYQTDSSQKRHIVMSRYDKAGCLVGVLGVKGEIMESA